MHSSTLRACTLICSSVPLRALLTCICTAEFRDVLLTPPRPACLATQGGYINGPQGGGYINAGADGSLPQQPGQQ